MSTPATRIYRILRELPEENVKTLKQNPHMYEILLSPNLNTLIPGVDGPVIAYTPPPARPASPARPAEPAPDPRLTAPVLPDLPPLPAGYSVS